jgi:hypothetical protein
MCNAAVLSAFTVALAAELGQGGDDRRRRQLDLTPPVAGIGHVGNERMVAPVLRPFVEQLATGGGRRGALVPQRRDHQPSRPHRQTEEAAAIQC